MALATGTRLGAYEIVGPIGAGGMGEVYRARDTRLDRTVAIKVLNSQLVASPELRARFEREAKVISQLQHPHICVLHDVGSENGTDYLVMEFLAGEVLAEKVKRGPLPLNELLKISIEVADALGKAHRAGIIHRDLKPGNVMLTKSGAKLLDFGLAKPIAAGASASSTSVSVFAAAATMTSPASPLSSAGAVIGTVQYMSPEQIQGQEADARSDVFAFGVVLYEMATGKRAFEGKTQSSIVGQILAVDPPLISAVQPMSPPALSRLVSTCLAKDPDERFQTIHDVKLRLQEIVETATAVAAERQRTVGSTSKFWWAAMAVVVIALGATTAYFANVASRPKPVVRSTILSPENSPFVTITPDSGVPVISPDGTKLAFIARENNGHGQLVLYVRALNSTTAQPLSGTSGAVHPFWSPDSRNLAFFAEGKLRRIDSNGGPIQDLAPGDRGRGGAWGPDGTILYVPGINDAIMQVPANGGTPKPASKYAPGEGGHRWPNFLPDGKHFLFWARGLKNSICVGTLGSLEHTVLFENAANAIYAEPGYVLFTRDRALMAQRFDAGKLALQGDPFPIADHVSANGPSFRGVFSVSKTGLLVYQEGDTTAGWQMQWVSADGKPLGQPLAQQSTFLEPMISPDGKRIVVSFADASGNFDLWVLDNERGTKMRLTFDPALDNFPSWSPDGSKIYFSSNRKGHADIYVKAADGSGAEEVVLEENSDKTWKSISSDGRYIAYERREAGSSTGTDIWVLPLFGDRKPFPIVQTPYSDGAPEISPDGRWLLYASDESKKQQVYITPFPGGGSKWQVSVTDGLAPRWRGDGKEIYYIGYDGNFNAVDITTTATNVKLGAPRKLFTGTLQALTYGSYSVTNDGKRFLLNGSNPLMSNTPLVLVTNWTEELKK
jgi:serine/threonine protein kinase